ncbi:MAG: preprotein translocase subunit SecE [Bacilli bacterium]
MATKDKEKNNKEKNKKVTKIKNNKTKVKKENYFKGVIKEMKLVKWPTTKEVVKYTIATLVLCVIICGFFLLLNLLLSIIKGWFV